jgi:PhnB protein
VPDLPVTEVRDLATSAVVTPYLAVAGAHAAIDWYRQAFGARLLHEPVVMPDGRVGHAELEVGGATFMLADQSPGSGTAAPAPGQPVPVTLHLEVTGVDAVVDRWLCLVMGAGSPARRGLVFGCARMALRTRQQPERPSCRRAQHPSRALGRTRSQYAGWIPAVVATPQ